jgi:hypothetical protein
MSEPTLQARPPPVLIASRRGVHRCESYLPIKKAPVQGPGPQLVELAAGVGFEPGVTSLTRGFQLRAYEANWSLPYGQQSSPGDR